MKVNQSGVERVIRGTLGVALVLISLFLTNIPDVLSWIIGIAGAIMIVTGAVAYCPAWHLLGISTVRKTPVNG